MSQRQCKISSWREKAKSRRIKIWALKKRIKELVLSRSKLRLKYQESQAELKNLRKQLSELERKKGTKIKSHTYRGEEIQFFMNLRNICGCSFRGCLRVLQVMNLLFNLEIRSPSPSSIRTWEIKLGMNEIEKTCLSAQDDWVLILDESVSIGSQKMLLLIGVNLGNYKFGNPLKMEDVEVLDLRIGKSWKSQEITPIIDSIIKRHYTFKYCCCDNGSNLGKALKMSKIIHIEDCGHCLGKILEKRYKKDEMYLSFYAKKILFKKQNLLSKYAEFLPPQQRSKGRFMNLSTTCVWAKKVLQVARKYEKQGTNPAAFEKIKWIIDYEEFILKLNNEQRLINQINKILKGEGLSKKTKEQCEAIVNESKTDEKFRTEILDYLNRNLEKLSMEEDIICSSDIIESIFGKLKHNMSKNPISGLTEGSLMVANFGKKLSIAEIKKGLESIKIVDIEEWRKENLPVSILQKRKKLFKNTG